MLSLVSVINYQTYWNTKHHYKYSFPVM